MSIGSPTLTPRIAGLTTDVQERLRAKLGDDVVTIDTDLLDAASEDPLALLRAFSPFTSAIAHSAENGGSVVLDAAAAGTCRS